MKISHWLLAFTLALAPLPASAQSDGGQMDLEVARARVLEIPQRVIRVSISNPAIADVVVLSRNGILLTGRRQGNTSLIVWTAGGRRVEYDLAVKMDTTHLQTALRRTLGSDEIYATYRESKLILTGRVNHQALVERAAKVAEGLSGGPVINLVEATAAPEIQVDVKVVELVKSQGQDTGMKWGSLRTKGANEVVFFNDLMTFGETGGPGFGAKNLLSFGQFDRLSAQLKLLVTDGKARVLAEPKLVVLSGASASVLVGGEFPVPTAQNLGQITITWRPYGVKLDILPQIMPDGRIALKVRPEVSSLDYNNAIKLEGFTLPSLRSRHAETSVVLGAGESLAIGGLNQQVETQTIEKLPLLGEIPILGALFSTTRRALEETELTILVSPRLVSPTAKAEAAKPEPKKVEPAKAEAANPEVAKSEAAKPPVEPAKPLPSAH